MAPPKQPTSIPAFFLGGNIPKAKVGDFLEQLYLHGEGGFQLQPVYEKPLTKKQLLEQQHSEAALPPAVNGHALLTPTHAPTREPGMIIAEYLYRLIAERQPIDRTAIGQVCEDAGIGNSRGITTELWRLKQKRWVVMDGTAYSLGPLKPGPFRKARGFRKSRAEAASPSAPPPSAYQDKAAHRKVASPDSQEGLILAYMREHPGPVPYADLRAYFKKKKLREESAGVAISMLKHKGFVKRIAPQTYEFIPDAP